MRYQAILFDLDGTLLPMDLTQFANGYFGLLAQRLAPYGVPADKIVPAVWAGTGAMMHNDGSRTNEDVFWRMFEAQTGLSKAQINDECLDFYTREFHAARALTGPNPLAKTAVALAHAKADRVALATNPLFPRCGQLTRISWLGLTAADFDLITSYEDFCRTKPDPAYFVEVCRRLQADPAACLMIGNDENEDMAAASAIGIAGYLVTDCVIKSPAHPWAGPRGSFADLVKMLETL